MIKKLFSIKDATLYSQFPNKNTGLDEILEVGKTSDQGKFVNRSVIQFDLSNPLVPNEATFDLILRVASAEKLKVSQGVEVWQLIQSWVEGTGYLYQTEISADDGVTWTQNSSGSYWASGSQGGLTGSLSTSSVFEPSVDLRVDVTSIVRSWLSGSVVNNGFLIKFPNSDEQNITYQGNIKFFSNQTHTISSPVLVAKWDDQLYVTGSNQYPPINLTAIPSTLSSIYRVGETVRVELSVREKYPLKTFTSTGITYSGDHYLPSSSYFSIIDEQTGNVIVPFDNFSKINTNGNKSYFIFKIQDMYINRFYRVLIKVDHDGLSEIFDSNSIFTIK